MRSFFFRLILGVISTLSFANASAADDPLAPQVADMIRRVKPEDTYPPLDIMTNAAAPRLFIAAMKQNPEGPWRRHLSSWFAGQTFNAKGLPKAERQALYKEAHGYLRQARAVALEAFGARGGEEIKEDLRRLDASIALAALEAGLDTEAIRVETLAALAANTDTNSWNFGNVVFNANSLLGRIALRNGDLEEARKHLQAAGETRGSPQLNSFGPSLVFAREMAEAGEKEAVVSFLDSIARFWANPAAEKNEVYKQQKARNREQVEQWKAELVNGKIPEDRRWW